MTTFLVGIDDTDAPEGRGTGYRARQLGARLGALPGARLHSVARHQLLVDPQIPYTSHNSSACLWLDAPDDQYDAIVATSRLYLLQESAAEADPGLCVAPLASVTADVVEFGRLAQRCVTTMDAASAVAAGAGIYLEGLAGTRGGQIGALAAVGLRRAAEHGRMLWLPGLRELHGVMTVQAVCQVTGIDAVETERGDRAAPETRIYLGDWARPILRGGRIVLLVERSEHDDFDVHVAAKETIKRYSE